MEKKVNREALGLPTVNDVVSMYNKLLPWEKVAAGDIIGEDFRTYSDEDIVHHFGIKVMDLVTEGECYDEFGTSLLPCFRDYELLDEIENRVWRIDGKSIVDIIKKKSEESEFGSYYFKEKDLDELEKTITSVREKLNNKAKKQ